MKFKYSYINRFINNRVKKLFENFACVVVLGTGQIGKSTLLQHLYPDIPCVIFDPIHDIQNAKTNPELFLNNNPPPLILDEIQYVPQPVPIIKRQIDQQKQIGLYILTSSQQWRILNQISESLARRAILTHLEGFP